MAGKKTLSTPDSDLMDAGSEAIKAVLHAARLSVSRERSPSLEITKDASEAVQAILRVVANGLVALVLMVGLAQAETIEEVMAESSANAIQAEAVQAASDTEAASLELSDLGHKGLVVAGWSWIALGAALVAGADADEVKPIAGLMAAGVAVFVLDVIR